jgi:hypothetical protein
VKCRCVEADESGTFFLDLLVEVVEVDGLVRGDVAGQHLLNLLRCCRPPRSRRRRDAEIGAGAFDFGQGNSCRKRECVGFFPLSRGEHRVGYPTSGIGYG